MSNYFQISSYLYKLWKLCTFKIWTYMYMYMYNAYSMWMMWLMQYKYIHVWMCDLFDNHRTFWTVRALHWSVLTILLVVSEKWKNLQLDTKYSPQEKHTHSLHPSFITMGQPVGETDGWIRGQPSMLNSIHVSPPKVYVNDVIASLHYWHKNTVCLQNILYPSVLKIAIVQLWKIFC